MSVQFVLLVLTFALLPAGLGLLHLLHLRMAWGVLMLVSGGFSFAYLFRFFTMERPFVALWFSFLAVAAAGVYNRTKLGRNERIGHAILGTSALCMTTIVVFDLFNLRVFSLTDGSTGLITGLILSAILFGRSRRKR